MLSRDCYDNHVLGPAELDEEVCSCRTDAKAGSANSVCWQHFSVCEFSLCMCFCLCVRVRACVCTHTLVFVRVCEFTHTHGY